MGTYLEKNLQTFIEMQKRFAEQARACRRQGHARDVDAVLSGQAPVMQGLMGNYLEQSQEAVRADAGADGQAGRRRCSRACRGRRKQALRPWRGDAATIAAMTSDTTALRTSAPKIGFVSLGCPKALTDSELILTQLARRGLRHQQDLRRRRPRHRQHLRLHRRCGQGKPATRSARRWPTTARSSSPAAWAPRRARAAATWCASMHPKVLAVTGPHATQEVMDAVHLHVPEAARPVHRPGAGRRASS